jgi:hypothetical protein
MIKLGSREQRLLPAGPDGDDFDGAADKILAALDRMIGKLDEWLSRMATAAGLTLPTPNPVAPAPGAPPTGGGEPPPGPSPNGGDYTTPLAAGGIVMRPTRALIGEAGPEAVIPLDRLRLGGTDRTTQTITVQLDGRVLARSVARGLPSTVAVYGAA